MAWRAWLDRLVSCVSHSLTLVTRVSSSCRVVCPHTHTHTHIYSSCGDTRTDDMSPVRESHTRAYIHSGIHAKEGRKEAWVSEEGGGGGSGNERETADRERERESERQRDRERDGARASERENSRVE